MRRFCYNCARFYVELVDGDMLTPFCALNGDELDDSRKAMNCRMYTDKSITGDKYPNPEAIVTNSTTALMCIRDLAMMYHVPISIHFDNDHYMRVFINPGSREEKKALFYLQDLYQEHTRVDKIWEWMEEQCKQISELKKGEE